MLVSDCLELATWILAHAVLTTERGSLRDLHNDLLRDEQAPRHWSFLDAISRERHEHGRLIALRSSLIDAVYRQVPDYVELVSDGLRESEPIADADLDAVVRRRVIGFLVNAIDTLGGLIPLSDILSGYGGGLQDRVEAVLLDSVAARAAWRKAGSRGPEPKLSWADKAAEPQVTITRGSRGKTRM